MKDMKTVINLNVTLKYMTQMLHEKIFLKNHIWMIAQVNLILQGTLYKRNWDIGWMVKGVDIVSTILNSRNLANHCWTHKINASWYPQFLHFLAKLNFRNIYFKFRNDGRGSYSLNKRIATRQYTIEEKRKHIHNKQSK